MKATSLLIALIALSACAHKKPEKEYGADYKLGTNTVQDKAMVRKVLLSFNDFFNSCIQEELDSVRLDHQKPNYKGKVTIGMDISTTGDANGIRIRSANNQHSEKFKNCVRKVIDEEVELPPTTGKPLYVEVEMDFVVDETNRLIWR